MCTPPDLHTKVPGFHFLSTNSVFILQKWNCPCHCWNVFRSSNLLADPTCMVCVISVHMEIFRSKDRFTNYQPLFLAPLSHTLVLLQENCRRSPSQPLLMWANPSSSKKAKFFWDPSYPRDSDTHHSRPKKRSKSPVVEPSLSFRLVIYSLC